MDTHRQYSRSMTRKTSASSPDGQVGVSDVTRVRDEGSLLRLLDDMDRELGPISAADVVWANTMLGLG